MRYSTKLILLIFLFFNYVETKASLPYRNVMYFGDWSIYDDKFYPSKMNAKLITHLNFAFMDLDSNGDLVVLDEYADFQINSLPELDGLSYADPYTGVIGAMAILKIKNPHLKVGISVGGWTNSGDFPAVSASERRRKNFAKNIVKFIDYIGFDFVDIDWEYPTDKRDPDGKDEGCPGTPEDTENFTKLLQAIRDELDALGEKNDKYYELSIAMSASPYYMAKIEYDKVLDIVDFSNMMTYSAVSSSKSYTAHHTALYTNDAYDHDKMSSAKSSADYCIKYFEQTYGNTIDYKKILIGVAPYTKGWGGVKNDGLDPKNPGLYATATPNSVEEWPFHKIPAMMEKYNVKEYFDETAQAGYYYGSSSGYFFTCDNERSVAAKGKYVRDKGLGGLIAWMASLDGENVITKTMFTSLYGEDYEFPDEELVFSEMKASAKITTKNSDYEITINNLESVEETNVALKDAELFHKSIMSMKIYIKTKSGAKFYPGSMCGTVTNENGIGIVDPSSNSSAKKISPGKSYTFTVKVDGTADISDIESITMTQRIVKNTREIKKQVIYKK